MRKITNYLLISFITLVFILGACKKDSSSDTPTTITGPPITPVNTTEIELSERTINVASEPLQLESVVAGTYTYILTDVCPEIRVGDILIGDDENSGYVRKVTQIVSYTESRIVLNTIEAAWTEAVTRCDIEETFDFPMLTPVFPVPGVHVTGDSLFMNNYVLVDQTFIIPPIITLNLYAAVDQAYVVIKNPTIDFELHMVDGEATEFRSLYEANIKFGCDISVDVTAFFDYDMDPILLYNETKTIKHMAGPVPVIHKVTASIYLHAHLDMLGQLNTSISGMGFDQNVSIGGHYKNSVWQDLNFAQISWNEPDISMSSRAKATLRPSLVIKVVDELYGIAGPSIRTEPYVEAVATYNSQEFCVEVEAGTTVGCGLQGMDFLGIDWTSPDFPLVSGTIYPEHCWPL